MSVCSLSYAACQAHAPYDIGSVACPAVPCFSRLSNKVMIFSRKVTEQKMFCAFLYNFFFSERFLILRRTERDMIKNVYASSCQVLMKL